ncbi:hypothetical protein A3J43_03995 [Candidatus Uhrbacteria bacterium RIFCSPHIGHO2_12_FULL_54_23]|uniref:DUF2339 domain-containing protein n=3 Tax=Candidatus Uhriibacteriota TaxID=1752732 RepID=A0A1F7UFG0_9BACT|nr:MAG: hypothetical protein A3J43_03995 [Candidatus Uhrbacteria bacterium RIFCSPHIGHO2_12_FULL_54_23]OGL85284.1 MAG: hypothetical protein A3B36_01380 [Candidatus Uhrbacteria bacterium RIFCSPLOWO2_01_FULL_55_36]OGL89529.1 MAG: hypothetical protein A3J36_00575 [Candidatus Uhrbacteria bacterium RIFCSPLOWO2_02_FULL_54_37]
MYAFLFILGIVLFVIVMNLRGRVKRLEALVRQTSMQPVVPQPVVSAQGELAVPQAASTVTPASPAPVDTHASDAIERFITWLKDDWLLKLGAALILIGFGWLVTYAFPHNWVGPMGRIALGLIAGTGILCLGWWRIRTYLNQGSVFLVLGSTTILVTIFAAREVYDFFTPLSALAVMFLSVVFVALASVRFKSHSLSLLSLAMAGAAPMLTSMPTYDYPVYFIYLLIVVLGTLWIVAVTRRQELTTAALILVAFYSVPHFAGSAYSSDRDILLLLSYAFAAVFFVATTLGILKAQGKELAADLVTAGGSGLLLLAWIMFAAQDEWKSLLIAAWMVVFAVGAFAVFRMTRRREPMYVYAGVAVAMLAAATAAELDGAVLTIAYTIECAVVALVAYVTVHDLSFAERLSLLLIGPFVLSFNSIFSRAWRDGVLHKDFFVLLILALVLLFLGVFFARQRRQEGASRISDFNLFLLIAGSAYIYLLMWRSLHAAFLDADLAAMIALVSYTLIGLYFYFYGRVSERSVPRVYGGSLLGCVVLRLFIVDVWSMELTGRIITFFMVGALLVSTAFLGRKKKEIIT